MSNKKKELNVDFIGGEELTPEEEAKLKDYFSKKKSKPKQTERIRKSDGKSKKDHNIA